MINTGSVCMQHETCILVILAAKLSPLATLNIFIYLSNSSLLYTDIKQYSKQNIKNDLSQKKVSYRQPLPS